MTLTREELISITPDTPITFQPDRTTHRELLTHFAERHLSSLSAGIASSPNWRVLIQSKLPNIQNAPDEKSRLVAAIEFAAWGYLGGIPNQALQTSDHLGEHWDVFESPEGKQRLAEAKETFRAAMQAATTEEEQEVVFRAHWLAHFPEYSTPEERG